MPVSSGSGGTQIRKSQDTGLHTGFLKRPNVEVIPHVGDRMITAIHNNVFKRDPLNDPRRPDPRQALGLVVAPTQDDVSQRPLRNERASSGPQRVTAAKNEWKARSVETVETPVGPISFPKPPKPSKHLSAPSTNDLDFFLSLMQGDKRPLPRLRFYD